MKITPEELQTAFQRYSDLIEKQKIPKITVRKELLDKWKENRRRVRIGLPRLT